MIYRVRRTLAIGALLVLGTIPLCVRAVFARFRVANGAMAPMIQPGQHVWALRHAYALPGDVRRGDVVTFLLPDDEKSPMVKRIIGLPGDSVEVAAGRPSVSGRALLQDPAGTAGELVLFREQGAREGYLVAYGSEIVCERTAEPRSTVLGPGEFFVLGDNRCATRDSRHFGPVPFRLLTGRVLWVE